jgi:predicted secreted protein
MCKRRDVGEEQRISCHNRSDAGEKDPSSEAKISPNLTVPKKDVSAAAHTTCLSRLGQSVAAMRCPNRLRRGKVMTRLVFGLDLKVVLTCSIPFRRSLESSSSVR